MPRSEAAAMEEEWVLDIVELRLGYVVGAEDKLLRRLWRL